MEETGMGKFLLGAIVGAGVTGGVGAWLAGATPSDPPPTIEARQIARELQRVRMELRGAEVDRDQFRVLAHSFLDLLRARTLVSGPGANARDENPTSPD
jgi:hypothetical protein